VNSRTDTISTEYISSQTVTVSGDVGFSIALDLKEQYTWVSQQSTNFSTASGSSDSASVTIGGPSANYNGPLYAVQLYYDRLFKTYAFGPPQSSRVAFQGMLRSSTGNPVSATEVSFVTNGITYSTSTDAGGVYQFFGNINGPIDQIYSEGVRLRPVVKPDNTIDLFLP
jgi:hypothetical protein